IGGGTLTSGLGLLKGRRHRPPKPSLGRMAIGGAVVIVGAALWAMRTDPQAEPETTAADRFSSSSAPSLSLVAPTPWRLDYDRPNGRLVGLRDGARLMIESSLVTDNRGPDHLLDGITAKARERVAN